jgi:hypothetical protein
MKDRRPIERLVNKGLVERHTLNLSEEERVLTAAGDRLYEITPKETSITAERSRGGQHTRTRRHAGGWSSMRRP